MRPGPQLESAPFTSEIGQQILASTCQDCWQAWMGMSVKVINEYRLNMASPRANEIYDTHLREFLGLAGT